MPRIFHPAPLNEVSYYHITVGTAVLDQPKSPSESSAMDDSTPPAATEPVPVPPAEPEAAPAADGAAPAKPVKPVKVKKEESWWDTIRFLIYLFIGAVLLRTFL